uniref:LIM zinc-binding domain-containing protein n=1 Tax=Romanomermis culicivorax TaxID=13658 RepID=A0A915HGR0_ROMCU
MSDSEGESSVGHSRKIKCDICHKKCSGDALRANNKFYHIQCFTCKACQKQLNGIGFFIYENNYYCPEDYHSKFGNRCPVCNEFVEGEVVDCLGKTFHQQCFKCSRC